MLWITNIILFLFIGATIVQIGFWIFLFSKLAYYSDSNNTADQTKKTEIIEKPVSIIICARNEAENLKKNLPRIVTQNHRSFEVIVVNDNSSDQTENILLNFHIKYPNLRSLSIVNKPKGSGKKPALALGIQAAKHDVLLFTDADCQPTSEYWLRDMQKIMDDSVDIGLGYGPYYTKSGFLNKFIRFETILTAIQYFSYALIGQTYMGVGRNLIYRKHLFGQADGFKKHENLLSGDDDLFINEVATKDNVAININKRSFVYSDPQESWKAYYRQKARHVSTGKHYKLNHKILLGFFSSSHFFHYVGGVMLILTKTSMIFVILLYVVRILVILVICKPILRKLQDRNLYCWVPVLDTAYVFFYLTFALPLFTGKINRWT